MSIIGHQLAKDSCPWTGAQHTEGMAVGVPMQVPPSAEGGYRTGRETCQLPRDGVKQMRDGLGRGVTTLRAPVERHPYTQLCARHAASSQPPVSWVRN